MKLRDAIKDFLLQEKRKKRKKKKTSYPYFVGPFYMSYNLGGDFNSDGGDVGGDGGGMMEEAVFPEGFDVEQFKEIKTFRERLQYCNERLKKLGAGTGRIAYQIDDGTVLKLAKNARGVAQNEAEDDSHIQRNFPELVPKIYEGGNDVDGLWIICQLAKKISKKRFKDLVGIDFDFFANYISSRQRLYQGERGYQDPYKDSQHEFMGKNYFVKNFINFCQESNLMHGDFKRIVNYGEIDGEVVIVDTGLSEGVYQDHYQKGRMQEIISKDYYKPDVAQKYLNKIPWAKTDGEPVGHGKMGTAFMTDDGDLLKLTYDSDEADMAKKLLNKNLTYFPNIHRVAQFKRSKIYVILKEFVEVNEDISDVFESFEQHIGMAVRKSKISDSVRYFDFGNVIEYFAFNINRLSQDVIDDVKEKLESENKKFGKLFLDFLGMIREAKKYDMVFVDFIHHNIGMKNGNYCFFDNGGHANDKVDVEDLENEFINEAIGVDDYDEVITKKMLSQIPGVDARFIVGHGSRGTAFLTQDRKVVKLTKDSDEAVIGKGLIGNSLKHFPQIYYVGQFKKSKIFVVVKEYIRRSKEIENSFKRLEVNLGKATYDAYEKYNESGKEIYIKYFTLFEILQDIYAGKYSEDFISMIADELNSFGLKEFFIDVCGLITEASQYNISIKDLTSFNIGEKNGKICLFDYGGHRRESVDVEDLEKDLAENKINRSS